MAKDQKENAVEDVFSERVLRRLKTMKENEAMYLLGKCRVGLIRMVLAFRLYLFRNFARTIFLGEYLVSYYSVCEILSTERLYSLSLLPI